MKRTLLRVFLILFVALCGFAAGATISAAFFIAPGAGLAGAAEVFFYGVAGAIIAGIAGGFLVFRLGPKALSWAAFAAALILVVLFAWVFWSRQAAEEASALSPSQQQPITEPVPENSP